MREDTAFPGTDLSKQQWTCPSHIAALQEPPGTGILLKYKLWCKNYWQRLSENTRGLQKNRVKTHLASLCLPAWMERQWNCSPVMQHRGLGARGSLLDRLSLSNTSIPYQSGGFSWAVLTHHCPLHGLWTLLSALRWKTPWPSLQCLPWFSPRFSRISSLIVPCATPTWFDTCEGLINPGLTGNWAFLEDFYTVPKG